MSESAGPDGLSPALPPQPGQIEPNPLEPALGGLHDVRRALSDARLEVRRAAARALAPLDDGTSLDEWLVAARDRDAFVRAAAIAGLERYDAAPVLDLLLSSLADEDWLVRHLALVGLARREDPRITPALLDVLMRDPTLAPRAGRVLGRRAAAEPGLLAALLALLPGAPPWRRLAVATALGRVPDPAARAGLATLIGHPDREVEDAILAHGVAMLDSLLAALADPDWIRRWHASRLLARIGDPAAAVNLLPLAHDPRPEVRLAAIAALAALASPEALADLAACATDPSWHVRLAAVEALAALHRAGVAGAERALGDRLADPRAEVREAAARGLAGGQAGAGAAS